MGDWVAFSLIIGTLVYRRERGRDPGHSARLLGIPQDGLSLTAQAGSPLSQPQLPLLLSWDVSWETDGQGIRTEGTRFCLPHRSRVLPEGKRKGKRACSVEGEVEVTALAWAVSKGTRTRPVLFYSKDCLAEAAIDPV